MTKVFPRRRWAWVIPAGCSITVGLMAGYLVPGPLWLRTLVGAAIGLGIGTGYAYQAAARERELLRILNEPYSTIVGHYQKYVPEEDEE